MISAYIGHIGLYATLYFTVVVVVIAIVPTVVSNMSKKVCSKTK